MPSTGTEMRLPCPLSGRQGRESAEQVSSVVSKGHKYSVNPNGNGFGRQRWAETSNGIQSSIATLGTIFFFCSPVPSTALFSSLAPRRLVTPYNLE